MLFGAHWSFLTDVHGRKEKENKKKVKEKIIAHSSGSIKL